MWCGWDQAFCQTQQGLVVHMGNEAVELQLLGKVQILHGEHIYIKQISSVDSLS
jgi:hypothetical protein